ncbi:malto-oligosyltrehalose synthase [Gordonia sp. ABSL1-1]|uniref:malto-oligosyltrehalose synthase n=1 Tax=Gordonia sp. ABSL1-1 TaxID=3053923 RepID=UPI0025735449|nr:malto-oligosyltrehalose synthase [Gordonia sp. ABSL1-1]MDL9937442.1 malto-oligosyltrehalose synthase [Gordonia sp. ABSL1-1]
MTPRPPIATYRVQLTPDFGFAQVIGILGHLRDLGVSHLYLSPIGTAVTGSTHGYDWLPPPEVAPILGGLDGLRELRTAAKDHQIGIIIDIVPNHTGVADVPANPWFADLLRNGPASPYRDYFDVDFSRDNGADGKIALPILAADGDLTPLRVDDGGYLRYHDHALPIAAGTESGTPQQVHDRQHYRLVPWNSGLIGYRRFFTVNELAAVRQEDPAVYAATHRWLAQLVAEDLIDGVRVDHPDGLWDPQGYLRRLRDDLGPHRLIYIEKILAPDEPLEPSLPVQGTTGYDQLRVIDAVFVAPSGTIELAETHERITGVSGDSAWLISTEHTRKLTTLTESFAAEQRRLVAAVAHSTHDDRREDMVTDADLGRACAELIARLGVYRADYPVLHDRLLTTIGEIEQAQPLLRPALTVIGRATSIPGPASARLAQTCGAVTAKSVEDSLFYRTARLVSAQEVGGDPTHPSLDVAQFHAHNVHRARDWPAAMTASSTHDTKRGEDVRARIALLSQIPERWSLTVARIWQLTPPPDDLTGYFLLQNIFGVWPADGGAVPTSLRHRLDDYARKAAREAGLRTSWTAVDEAFESALSDWIAAVTDGPAAEVIGALVARMASSWEQEALARKAIALLGPGVGDIYQGTQWWEDSLVDPDNRRPVDYSAPTDHPKTQLIRAALGLRAAHPDAFGINGRYLPLVAEGAAADHVIGFARATTAGPAIALITARFTHSLRPASAANTHVILPAGEWRDIRTGAVHRSVVDLATARADHPVALLEAVGAN